MTVAKKGNSAGVTYIRKQMFKIVRVFMGCQSFQALHPIKFLHYRSLGPPPIMCSAPRPPHQTPLPSPSLHGCCRVSLVRQSIVECKGKKKTFVIVKSRGRGSRERERQTDRQTDRQTERKKERKKDRKTEKQKDRNNDFHKLSLPCSSSLVPPPEFHRGFLDRSPLAAPPPE